VINDFNYSSLAVLNDKTPKDHEKGIMLNCYKNGNNLYVTYMVDGYIILDKYSQSFELLKRNIYENQYLNINSGFYNLNMFSDNETININYSPDYKLFIKTIYE